MRKGNFRLLLAMGIFVSSLYGATAAAYPCGPCGASFGPLSNIDPFYAGAEYKLTQVEYRDDWKRIFTPSCPGTNLFFGGRFPNGCTFPLTFGLEFGYSWTVNKGKAIVIPGGLSPGSFQGVINDSTVGGNPTIVPIEPSGKVRFKSGYMDLKAYIPVLVPPCYQCYYPELVLALGVASSKPIITVTVTPTNATGNLITELVNLRGMTRSTLRAGVGIQAMFWDYWGVRAMARWENYSRLRANRSTLLTFSNRQLFHDGYSFSLGVFFTTQAW